MITIQDVIDYINGQKYDCILDFKVYNSKIGILKIDLYVDENVQVMDALRNKTIPNLLFNIRRMLPISVELDFCIMEGCYEQIKESG
jgi:hypothetical protein